MVDDNPDAVDTMAILLQLERHEVQTAYDGLEALEVAERFRPEVVVMDIGMPRLNGFEACRQIRQSDWGKAVVMVAVTGWGQPGDRERSDAVGFDFHFAKPVEFADLKTIIDAIG